MSCGGSKHANANAAAISETVADVNAATPSPEASSTIPTHTEHGPISQRQWGPLFHGTDREFAVGDIITPRSKKVAHAAPDLSTARVFAKRGDTGGYVYEVEPIGPFSDNEVWEQTMKYSDGQHEVLSRTGFRVVGKVPATRTEAFYADRRQAAAEHNTALGYAYCLTCKDTHLPDDHVA